MEAIPATVKINPVIKNRAQAMGRFSGGSKLALAANTSKPTAHVRVLVIKDRIGMAN